MRVKDFTSMYCGSSRVDVEIYASVTVFNEEHNVLVGEFAMDYVNLYTKRIENFLSEEVTSFEIVNDKLRLFIRGV